MKILALIMGIIFLAWMILMVFSAHRYGIEWTFYNGVIPLLVGFVLTATPALFLLLLLLTRK